MSSANPTPVTLNGAQVILRMLELHGVRHVFGLPGETTLGWYKEWQATSDIQYVLTRDERTASFAAEAYAKMTGRPAVLEAPSPGVTHCTPGIAEAYLSSVPIIFFSSDIPVNQDKRHGLTGLDQTALYSSICKESFYLTEVKDIPFMLRRAFRVATSGRPGPVHIRVPINIFQTMGEISDLYAEPEYKVYPAHRPVADLSKIREAIHILMASKKPVIVCGQGALISRASDVVLELAELLQIPVATTTPGKGIIAETHPLSLRVIGARGGMDYSNSYVRDADTVLFVGTNTDSSGTDHWTLYGKASSKNFIQLDVAEGHVGNNFPLKVGLVGDARATLEYMVSIIKAEYPLPQRDPIDLGAIKETALGAVFRAKVPMPNGTVSPVRLAQCLDEILPEDAIVTAEPGVSAIFPSALLSLRKAGRRYLTNYSMGALGYAVPAGIGAAYAHNGPIISITGDGSLAFVLGDFETIRRSGKNITVILTRNDTYGWIRGEAHLLEDVEVPWVTDFRAVDYIKIADAFDFHTARISTEADIEPALREAISYQGASFIEIMVPSQDQVVPFVPQWVRVAKERRLSYFS